MGEPEKTGDCVKVAIRMRPLSKKELGNNESSIIELEEQTSGDGAGSVLISDPDSKEKPAQFAFDIVFGTAVLQQTVYECIGKPALDSMFAGYNGTIFAYGQTGSGKSWSMMGGDGELRGIIPRVNEQLFVNVAEQVAAISTRRYLVMCSFFEIYNEIIFDLLNPCQDRSKLGAGLQVKEHPVLGIYVKDLQEIVVDNADKLGKLMDSGTKNRAVSSTLMNAVSSRSHSIFTIKVHQKDDEDKSRNVFAKLNLVDLAGSERQKGTGASGQTLKEGANINKSLSALGNVINALVENANGKKVFVPFRNSKLTRVLQESLGGNSLCTMLAALSPAACNYEETLSTLRYANRAKAIKVSATKNEEASQISRLNAEIEELKKKLAQAGPGGGGGGLMADEERQAMQAKFQQQLAEMQGMVSGTWEEKRKLSVEQETQMNKAMEEHKRQQRAMQDERRKRFRLLQDQADLELSLRGLLDTVQALPAVPGAAAGAEAAPEAAVPVPCAELRAGHLLRRWLKEVSSLASLTEALKQQSTMAMLFHSAFTEDLKLWVEGEESRDSGMARTGSRRALTKLGTLRRECTKLASMEEEARERVGTFAAEVSRALGEWKEQGRPSLLAQLKAEAEAESGEAAEGAAPAGAGQKEPGVPSVDELNVEDVGRILELVAKQAEARLSDFGALASLELAPTAALVVQGAGFVPGSASVGPEADHVRQLAAAAEDNGSAAASATATTVGDARRPPREERPLHEWVAEDAEDSVAGTQATLERLMPNLGDINKKRPPEELLARPPPKYVHDVALLCTKTTGFPAGLGEDWPESREGKLDIFEQISTFVSSTLGLENLDFDPENVLKGKEVPQTLRLLQLLAVAAARSRHNGCNGVSMEAQEGAPARNGLTRACDLAPALAAIAACLESAVDAQLARRDGGDGHASPTRALESNCRLLQERIQEEELSRTRLQDGMDALRKQVEESRALLAERTARLEEVRTTASCVSSRKQQLQRQLQELRAGLLQRAAQLEGNAEVVKKREQLAEITAKCGNTTEAKASLAAEVKRLQQRQVEAGTTQERLELEVKRIKLRLAGGLDGPTLHQSEDILLMQAEKQKWEVRVHGLEEKMQAIADADDLERQHETALMEKKQLQSSKYDDVAMQLQVIIEDRDGLRDGNEKLWLEKTRKEEELDDTSSGYAHASDRLMEKEEEVFELREQVEKFESLKALLQENFDKARQSPVLPALVPAVDSPVPPSLPPIAANGVAPPPPPDEDGGSSHYSDDHFEDPDDD